MATLSPDVLIAATPTTFARQETNAHFFKRVSHLNLQERRFTSLAGIDVCSNLRFLFAFGNRLRAIPEAVLELPALEILTLDRNDIRELRNLGCSRRLRKLHLSQNCISRVEGLEACDSLEELHVARQRRGDGAPPLSFESASIRALGHSLRWLDVSGCGLQSLADLAPCERLTRLDAADNALCDLSELLSLVHGSWGCLQTLDLRGNPALREQALTGVTPNAAAAAAANAAGPHWDLIVAAGADSLSELDGRPVADTTRAFVRAIARRRGLVLPGDFAAMRRTAEAEAAAARAAAEMDGGDWGLGEGGQPAAALAAPPQGGEVEGGSPLFARAPAASSDGFAPPAGSASDSSDSPPHSSARGEALPPAPFLDEGGGVPPPPPARSPAWAPFLAGPRLPPHADPEGQDAPAHRPARTPSDLARGSRFQASARVDAGLRLRLERMQLEAAVPAMRGAGCVDDGGSPRSSVDSGGGSGYSVRGGVAEGGPVAAPTQRRHRHRPLKGRPRSMSPRGDQPQAAALPLPPQYGDPGGCAAPSTRSFLSPRFGGGGADGPGGLRPPSAVWGGPPRFSARLPPLRKIEDGDAILAAAAAAAAAEHSGGPATGGRRRQAAGSPPPNQARAAAGAAASSSSSSSSSGAGGGGGVHPAGGSPRAGAGAAAASPASRMGRTSAGTTGPGGGRGTPGGLARGGGAGGGGAGAGDGAAPTVVASTLPQPPPLSGRLAGRQRLPVGAEGPLA